MRGRLTVFVCALVATLLIGIGTPGSANVIKRSDGNDTKGPLDLSGAKVSHVAGGSVFQINTLAPFTNAQANGKNGLFEVGIDSNADRDPNYFIDVFFAAGRFRGVLFKPNGSVITYYLKAARVSPKAVKVTLPHSQIIQKGSYDFLIFSAYFAAPCTNKNPCVDAIPNRYPLIRHDYTPPTITWGAVPTYSSDVSANLTFPVPFSLKDDVYGSGVKNWTLQSRVYQLSGGISAWTTVKVGTSHAPTVNVVGVDGRTYGFRVIAVDRQGNARTGKERKVSVPRDDANASFFQYNVVTPVGGTPSDAYLQTTSMVGQTGVIVGSVPSYGRTVCVLGGPTTSGTSATADLALDSIFQETLTEVDTTGYRQGFGCFNLTPGSGHDLTITVTSTEPFVFDGIVIKA
jgi:hypothetical protein